MLVAPAEKAVDGNLWQTIPPHPQALVTQEVSQMDKLVSRLLSTSLLGGYLPSASHQHASRLMAAGDFSCQLEPAV